MVSNYYSCISFEHIPRTQWVPEIMDNIKFLYDIQKIFPMHTGI